MIHVPPSSERREGVPLTVSIPCGRVGPSGIKYRGSGFAEVERGPVIIHLSSVASGCRHDHHGTSVTGLAAAKRRADIFDHAVVALRDRHDRIEEDAGIVVVEVPPRRLLRGAVEVWHVHTFFRRAREHYSSSVLIFRVGGCSSDSECGLHNKTVNTWCLSGDDATARLCTLNVLSS